jgi:hypothetical protein
MMSQTQAWLTHRMAVKPVEAATVNGNVVSVVSCICGFSIDQPREHHLAYNDAILHLNEALAIQRRGERAAS